MKKITGPYTKDSNFISIFSGNTLYVIPRNAPENWGFAKVGDWLPGCACFLIQEMFDSWVNECTEEGTFVLED